MTDTKTIATETTSLADRVLKDSRVLERLGIEVGPLVEDALELHLTVDESMVNAQALCHGGLLFALADTACAYALGQAALVPATTDASITYLRSAFVGDRVIARARVVKAGRRFGHCQVDLENQEGKLLAVFRGSCANVAAS